MAAACLPRASLVVGTELDDHRDVRAHLDDPNEPAILLWPGPGARDLATDPPREPVTLVVVDGTWPLAKKLVRINPRIASLPRYAITPDVPSRYQIRSEPRAECVSTLEAVMHALGILEGDPNKFQPMLEPFLAMIRMQLEHEASTQGRGRGKRPRDPRPRLVPPALRGGRSLVVVAGEANAWPRRVDPSFPNGTPPDELVQWVAVRVEDGAIFEAVVAPRNPLAPSTPVYTDIDSAVLRSGVSPSELVDRWRAFVRDDDVLCAWGPYGPSLLKAEGAFLPSTFVDLRSAATRWLRDKAGTIESFCERIGSTPTALGLGRGGRRLGMALEVTRHLVASARLPSLPVSVS